MPRLRILVLTNRDSDNVGDQIIEATVISLIRAAMADLGFADDQYSINSRAAGIISKKYMATGDAALLEDAHKTIASSDVVIFGGAPLFNYSYQDFYLRTIRTLEIAQEHGVPVLFSSIGVEPFDASNPKSLRLRDALHLPVVKQITTRDDLISLTDYVAGTDIPVSHVSDPAVFADVVLGAPVPLPGVKKSGRSTIGLVVTRAGIFKANGVAFSEKDQLRFWSDTIALLEERGYDYRLLTTGHFSDEAFLDTLVRSHSIPLSKAGITVNSPEELRDELGACDGVIAYRLHASITSFAYGIPSVGLSWNFKVPYFYESVGYGDRALDPSRWTAVDAVDAVQRAIEEGVHKDPAFLHSVYETLFQGLQGVFATGSDAQPQSYEQLRRTLPPAVATTPEQYRDKVRKKLRRAYEHYERRLRPVPPLTIRRRVRRKLTRILRRLSASWARLSASTPTS